MHNNVVAEALAVAALFVGVADGLCQCAAPSPTPTPTPAPALSSRTPTHMPCRQARLARERLLDATHRELYETLCGASLWLDGRFGEYGSLEAAEQVNGHADVSVLRSNLEGTKVKTGLDVKVTLPQMEHRFHAFLGRIDPKDYVQDRQEGFGLRSQFVSLET